MFDYTPEQLKAINTLDKNLQIIACAGSGKTQVISQRVVNILKSKRDIAPANIVAFTYTEKAAGELKHRILKLCKEQIGDIKGLAEMYVGTIHSWCLRILQDNIYEYQKFSVLDEIKLKLFVDRNYNNIGMKELDMERYKDTDHFIALMSIIRESEFADSSKIPNSLRVALQKYEDCLSKHCFFDFTMIMTRALNHINYDNLFREKLGSKIKYLTCDEYQDVNPIQEKIIYQIYSLGANICVVGDDDQTIYQWRGSDIHYIQNFNQKYNNVEFIKLEDNFRSSNGIISSAIKVINNNSNRLPKEMNAAGHQSFEKGDLLFNQYDSVEDENQFIVNTIINLRGTEFKDKEDSEPRGLDYSDFCILLRKWKKANKITEALKLADIPFIVAGVNNLFDQPEIKASIGIFQYLARKIDKELLKILWLELSANIYESDLENAIKFLNKKFPDNLSFYESFILQEVFWKFLDLAGIREQTFENNSNTGIVGNTSNEIIFYNFGMFSQVINDFEIINFMSKPQFKLYNFLNFLKYSAEGYYPEGWLNNTYKTPNAVQLMTIYQAKGLEFPVVFIPGLNRNYLPSCKRGGRSVWHFLDRELIKDQHRYEGTEEDERRLLYVAITRSQKFLMISRAPDGRLEQKESIFCQEVRKSDHIFSSPFRNFSERKRIRPNPKPETGTIELNFSILKTFFECPYSFKVYCMYGFKDQLSSRMGYGRSIHNILMEIHRQYLEGIQFDLNNVPQLLDRHFHLPYAIEDVIEDMRMKANKSVDIYITENRDSFKDIEFAEKDIQLDLGDGIMVNGRMDLIKKKQLDGTYQTYIIDFKSSQDAQTYNVSMEQLSLYALGYQALSGEKADFLQIYDLDKNDYHTKELLTQDMVDTRELIINAANKIRSNELDKTCDQPNCVCLFKHIHH